ncbi:hypothetical protein ARMSODRAFT_1056627 [Armillaria solidipes]|uniref:Uncharacterized protein n=1 Tax=Armillaria solidipes TaxID=1076256 RepID=A0A2H3BM24_9AGAR|nr:hypothetical protein ARMSODRAFT_1056627 [Armillaria solidipes]
MCALPKSWKAGSEKAKKWRWPMKLKCRWLLSRKRRGTRRPNVYRYRAHASVGVTLMIPIHRQHWNKSFMMKAGDKVARNQPRGSAGLTVDPNILDEQQQAQYVDHWFRNGWMVARASLPWSHNRRSLRLEQRGFTCSMVPGAWNCWLLTGSRDAVLVTMTGRLICIKGSYMGEESLVDGFIVRLPPNSLLTESSRISGNLRAIILLQTLLPQSALYCCGITPHNAHGLTVLIVKGPDFGDQW